MKTLQAGAISVLYTGGFPRRISYGENEVLRMIYFALRDHNWNTVDSVIKNENISFREQTFEITYDSLNMRGGVCVMEWKVKIEGHADSALTFEIHGTAMETFRKNRAGFCVLHPLSTAGDTCHVRHPDNTESALRFPIEVAADNPFRNITSMLWKSGGVPFSLEFEGDIFETEDQRNWGDASYKTFCTPLTRPFPVELKRGETVFQRIVFRPVAVLPPAKVKSAYISLHPSSTVSMLPRLGIAASTESTLLNRPAIDRLRPLRFNHYRIDLHTDSSDWVADFSNGYENAYSLGIPLEVALHLSKNFQEELDAFVVLCQQNRVRLRQVLLLQTGTLVTPQEIIDCIPALKDQLPNVQIGAGTNYNFNEINKDRFQGKVADFISFSMDPQEHATDDLTVLENAESPGHLVRSAKAIWGEQKPVHISPLTLRKRFNPYATNPGDLFIDESAKADPRQREPITSAWTLASICSLSRANASAVTLYQSIGNQGILSPEGEPFPVYDMLKNLAPYQGKSVRVLDSSDPLTVQGMVLEDRMLAFANLSSTEATVRWQGTDRVIRAREIVFEFLNRS